MAVYRAHSRNSKNSKREQGITLIALVVTIIVLLILASVTIGLAINGNGIFGMAKEAKFKQKMAEIAEEWQLNVGTYVIDRQGIENIYAGEVLKEIIFDEGLEIDESEVQDIKSLIKKVTSEEEKYCIIHEGELYYVSNPTIKNNKKQEKWCRDIGIKIWEYSPENSGIKVVNGNYENINGMYMCTPQLTTGFVKEKTRYMKQDSKGKLVPGTWINKKPEDDWYDYKEKKWANIYVESSGIESYYVWIPRYVYKLENNERTDVKFVDINNNYKDGETDEEIAWETLKGQGYQVPEAFYWGDNEENYTQNTAIPGYWMSKYQLSELLDTDEYTVDFNNQATMTSITIEGIKVSANRVAETGKEVAKYIYAVNGNIVHESTNGEDYTLKGVAKGNKAINVTIVDKDGEIIGSMTKLYETADVNEPELTGFDPDTTFYVYWDENGVEHNEVPISTHKPPELWYDYTTRNWANIVTRNNGVETYLVWIPRYQYALDTVSQRTYVKFIKGIGGATESGYQVPEAFYWGDNEDYTKNTPIKGYWMSKYQLSDRETTPKITAEMTGGSNEIKIGNITGSSVTDNLKYEYYINGEKVHEGDNKNENYTYTGLEGNTKYTINIIARNKGDNKYVGAITKKVETVTPNEPELTGFSETNTYYVEYDANGENPRVGEKIKNDGSNRPKDWYNYAGRKWANIVVTDGEVRNGKIEGASKTTYLVWVPRYAYSLDTQNQRTNIKFSKGIEDTKEAGYQVPEAFYWGDNENYTQNTPIKGYWMSKYQLSN